jgi:hypothetical protein
MHIKPVLIASLIAILILVAGVLAIYFSTRPEDKDFRKDDFQEVKET